MNTSNKTLLQILVEELPKLSPVPYAWNFVYQDWDKELRFDGAMSGIYPEQLASNHRCAKLSSDDPEFELVKVTRDQYEAALAAKNDGWIEWAGGECPLKKGTIIDTKDRDGHENFGEVIGSTNNVDNIFWQRGVCSYPAYEIIAYRLHQPQEAVQAKADDEADLNDCIGQTQAPVWNGEGLPPVGVEFEYGSHRSRAKCLAIGLHYVFASKGNPDDEESNYEELLIDAGTEYYPVDEDRAAIRNVIKDTGIMSSYADKIANALIDAGYRKQ